MEMLADVSNLCNIVGRPTLATFSIALVIQDKVIGILCASYEVVDISVPNLWQPLFSPYASTSGDWNQVRVVERFTLRLWSVSARVGQSHVVIIICRTPVSGIA